MNFLTPQLREVAEELIELRYKLLVKGEVQAGGQSFCIEKYGRCILGGVVNRAVA